MEEDEEILRGPMSQSELDLSRFIKCAASDISLTEAILSPTPFFFLDVCKSPQCNIMDCKDSGLQSYRCYITEGPNIKYICFCQLRKNSHKRILSFHPKYTDPEQCPVKVGHFLPNVGVKSKLI